VSFILKTVLPADARHAATARFLVVARQAAVMYQSLMTPLPGVDSGVLERRLVMLAYYVGALKELADAFRDLDQSGYLNWLGSGEATLPDLHADIQLARTATDRSSPTSLYCRLLKRVRDDAGFHVQRKSVLQALEALSECRYDAAEVAGPNGTVTWVPAASAVLAHLIYGDEPSDLPSLIDQARQLHRALENAAHDIYFLLVRFATELPGEAV
jgi:hypothetical protein